jgi:hypothetical protein
MRNRYATLAAVIFVSTGVNASVISNTNINLHDGDPFSDYALTVFQDEPATDPTTMWFNASGPTLSWANMNVDEGSEWYLTSLGDQFCQDTIQRSEFAALVSGNPLSVGFGDFYLGVNTGNPDGTWGASGIPPRNLYGWVHLQNVGGTITMLGNAMSYQGDGIVIGTTTVIPEPSISRLLTLSLGVVSAFAAGLRKGQNNKGCIAAEWSGEQLKYWLNKPGFAKGIALGRLPPALRHLMFCSPSPRRVVDGSFPGFFEKSSVVLS